MLQSDTGECLIGTHNCSQICVQLDEGYECKCSNGYKLRDDRVTCEGMDLLYMDNILYSIAI